jgi:16S rRNA G966 N2-methylase RsmD
VGIEALSRGAQQVIFIENHSAGVALLRRNLESLGITVSTRMSQSVSRAVPSQGTAGVASFPSAAELLALDFESAVERLGRRLRADFVFADPPYANSDAYESVLEFLGEGDLLAKEGRAIVEHTRRRVLPAVAGKLERSRIVQQGDSALSFYHLVRAA